MCGKNVYNVFLLAFMVLWVPIFVMLYKTAVPKLWHAAFMLLGLTHMGAFPSCLYFLFAW
jgi:hypothetical protein